jgi:hypothetical protein
MYFPSPHGLTSWVRTYRSTFSAQTLGRVRTKADQSQRIRKSDADALLVIEQKSEESLGYFPKWLLLKKDR